MGVTGTRASVSDKVQALLREIKEVCLIKRDLDSMLQKYDTQSWDEVVIDIDLTTQILNLYLN